MNGELHPGRKIVRVPLRRAKTGGRGRNARLVLGDDGCAHQSVSEPTLLFLKDYADTIRHVNRIFDTNVQSRQAPFFKLSDHSSAGQANVEDDTVAHPLQPELSQPGGT
jgi:hypothetical protein